MNQTLGFAGIGNFAEMLFVIGGTLDQGISSSVFGFDPVSKEWHKFPDIIKARACHRAVFAENEGAVVVVGGSNEWPSKGFGECEILKLQSAEEKSVTWQPLPSLQHPRSCHGLCYMEGKVFACGGMGNPEYGYGIDQFDLTASCEMLDLTSNDPQWHAFPKLNLARFGLQLLPVNIGSKKLLLAIGGRGPNPAAEYSVEAFDFSSADQKWVLLKNVKLVAPRIDFAAALVQPSSSAGRANENSCTIAPSSVDIVILGGNRVTRDEETDSSRTWEVLRLSLAQDGNLHMSAVPGGKLPSSRVGCRATVLQQLVPGKQHLVVAGGFKAWGEGQTTYGGPLTQSVAVLEIKADSAGQAGSDSVSGSPGSWVDSSDKALGEELQNLPMKIHAPAVCAARVSNVSDDSLFAGA